MHSQITWISALNLEAGVLADTLAIIMANLVAGSHSLFSYILQDICMETGISRYWFFMLFFIGSMQLIVLSDNLLMVFLAGKV